MSGCRCAQHNTTTSFETELRHSFNLKLKLNSDIYSLEVETEYMREWCREEPQKRCRECKRVTITSSRKSEHLRKILAHRDKLVLVYMGDKTKVSLHSQCITQHYDIYSSTPLTYFLLSIPSPHSPHSPHSTLTLPSPPSLPPHLPISSNAASITAAPLSMVAMRMSCPGQSTKETCRSSLKCPPQPVLSQGKESAVELPHDR